MRKGVLDRLFILLCVVALTTFIGYLLAKKYRQKKTFFTQFSQFNERFLSEISYLRRPLFALKEKYDYDGEFALLLDDFYANLGENALKTAKLNAFFEKRGYFTQDEKSLTIDYFSTLGKGNGASQKAYFTAVKTEIDRFLQKAKEEEQKRGELYVKLGFLIGLTILVVAV